jgi:hypothetical protein
VAEHDREAAQAELPGARLDATTTGPIGTQLLSDRWRPRVTVDPDTMSGPA